RKYDQAMKAAKDAEDARDYATAEQKYGEAMQYRAGDAKAKQGQERVKPLAAAVRNYDQAMKAAKDAEDTQDYALAEQKYVEAMQYRASDAKAKQGQERVKPLAAAARNYDQAMKAAKDAEDALDYALAEQKYGEAMQYRTGDAKARQG